MQAPALRYVVLRHEGVPRPHFDLMWEQSPGSALIAVRCHDWPPGDPAQFERLPDHRREYLDYEGAISGGRGHVRRVASGTCTFASHSRGVSVLRLDNAIELTIATGHQHQ